jgi:hypothetical protein
MSLSSPAAQRSVLNRCLPRRGLIAVMICAPLLAACSPAFNWREVKDIEQGFSVLLPGKPATMTRSIDLDGLPVSMTMTGARAEQGLFSVGSIRLANADTDPALRERALTAMRVAMLRNVGASVAEPRPVRIARTDLAGTAIGQVDAVMVQAPGRVADRVVVLSALFAGRGDRLWQAVAILPEAHSAQAQTLLDSFRIIE